MPHAEYYLNSYRGDLFKYSMLLRILKTKNPDQFGQEQFNQVLQILNSPKNKKFLFLLTEALLLLKEVSGDEIRYIYQNQKLPVRAITVKQKTNKEKWKTAFFNAVQKNKYAMNLTQQQIFGKAKTPNQKTSKAKTTWGHGTIYFLVAFFVIFVLFDNRKIFRKIKS